MKVFVLLPAYNEEESLPLLLRRFAACGPTWGRPWQVTVIDDGSTDETVARAQGFAAELPLEIIRHEQNRGLAAGFRTGINHACAQADAEDVLVSLDADNTHDPALIARMLERIEDGSDVVIASRFVEGGRELGLRWHRKLLSRGARAVLTVAFPMRGVRDYSCGFRAVRVGLLQAALARYGADFIQSTTFAATVEMLVKLRPFAPRIEEVPLVLRYDLKEGASKMRVLRTILGYVELIRQCR